MHDLTPSEISRYGRHLTLPEVGVEGQARLKRASVALIGAGGLGSPLGLYLAAAGVGRIGLVEFDTVDESNLQRQILYGSADVGRPKLDVALERLASVNPHIQLEPHPTRLSADNALDLLGPYDLVLDGTDNFPTRYLVNDACVLLGKPNVYGSIFRFEGQVSVFSAGGGPCYRCLYPEPPQAGAVPSCAEGGVLGVLPGTIGTLQATEALKLILGRGEPLIGRLLLFNALEMRFRELKLRRDPACPACGDDPQIRELAEAAYACPAPPRPTAGADDDLSAEGLRARLGTAPEPLLLDVRTDPEWRICRLDNATLIPLQELESRTGELDRQREIIVYCHHGMRSAAAQELLRARGFTRVRNLVGGIDAWAASIDPQMPRY